MRRQHTTLKFLAFAFMSVLLANCAKEDDPAYAVTQDDLDKVSGFVEDITGGMMAHGGPPLGTIVTKQTWKRGSDGNKTDQLYVSFAMVKREAGYYPDGGDWEYIMMPYNGSTDYSTHPFGMLPDEGAEVRGKLSNCASCHSSASGADYIYVND